MTYPDLALWQYILIGGLYLLVWAVAAGLLLRYAEDDVPLAMGTVLGFFWPLWAVMAVVALPMWLFYRIVITVAGRD